MAPMKTMKAMKSGSKVMTKGALIKTIAEQHEIKKSGIRAPCKLGHACHDRGQEDWHLHHPRLVQDQDSREASQDCYQGLPSCCTQGPDLSGCALRLHTVSVPEIQLPWESHGTDLGISALIQAVY